MRPLSRMAKLCEGLAVIASLMCVAMAAQAAAEGCWFEVQGEGRVAAVVDARTFRLEDGREVRLAGIEPIVSEKSNSTSALSAIGAGREVTLRGHDDTPDRYERQPAFGFLASSETPVQPLRLAQGQALVARPRT